MCEIEMFWVLACEPIPPCFNGTTVTLVLFELEDLVGVFTDLDDAQEVAMSYLEIDDSLWWVQIIGLIRNKPVCTYTWDKDWKYYDYEVIQHD